ncbi:hypothetical protein AAHE18_13G260800 [Arachis hypogaea]
MYFEDATNSGANDACEDPIHNRRPCWIPHITVEMQLKRKNKIKLKSQNFRIWNKKLKNLKQKTSKLKIYGIESNQSLFLDMAVSFLNTALGIREKTEELENKSF